MPRGKRPRPLAERFWEKVDKAAGPDGCWLWTAAINPQSGYGMLMHKPERYAHRLAYILTVGPIPAGMEIDHVYARGCRHRHCVNPAHLEAVTHRENMRRGKRGRQTHCKRTQVGS